ncbi:copper resistance protein CopC [Gryllotalpicola reticulitermitis]|uniref:Copper resistance protein CopC n=1 Tax=Gryllotalpicola reticulitermitis TaxID=1184153 RepID=A0ABV8Q8R0_9MICO
MPRTKILAALGAALAAAALAVLPATAASAHDYLVSSTPTAGTTVTTSLPQVTLIFDDIVLDDGGHGALVQVTDASSKHYETGCATVQGRDVSVPVALGAAGTYRVTWQIVSADGHPVSNSIEFNYKGPAAGQGATGPLKKCGTTISAPAAEGTATVSKGTTASPLVIGIIATAGGLVLLAIVAVVIVVIRSGRKAAPTE